MEQFHEIVRILGHIRQHGMNMDDSIAIASIIDKLPPSWKKVHRSLMQRKEEITMEQLGAHLYVEEGIRQKESKNKGGPRDTRASGSAINLFKKNGKGKGKAYVKCWVCNGPHFKKDCEVWKKRKTQMEGKSSGDHGQTDDSWWVDTGATRHVCKDINLYKVYKSLENGPSLENHFALAEEAYRLAVDAWLVLSVPAQRALFDEELKMYPKFRSSTADDRASATDYTGV
nr:zinc finger, CCHC-type [Ipomoea batatas]